MNIHFINKNSKQSLLKRADEKVRNPQAVWNILVSLTLLSFLVFAIAHYFLFQSFTSETEAVSIASQSTGLRAIREDKLSEVADYFKHKEMRHTELSENPLSIVDPSL